MNKAQKPGAQKSSSDQDWNALWEEPSLLFFGGKGGVGKTTLSAAISLYLAANKNMKVLIVSTDPAHNLNDIYQKKINGITKIAKGLYACELDPYKAARQYVQTVKKTMYESVGPDYYEQIDQYLKLAMLSPGLSEAALLDSLTRIILEAVPKYDKIIVDTAPTGHTLRLMLLPQIMHKWTDLLIKKRKTSQEKSRNWKQDEFHVWGDSENRKNKDRVLQILEKRQQNFLQLKELLLSKKSAFYFILNPEPFSFEETKRAITELQKGNIEVGTVIINKAINNKTEAQIENQIENKVISGAKVRKPGENEETAACKMQKKIVKWAKNKNVLLCPSAQGPVYGIKNLRQFTSVFEK